MRQSLLFANIIWQIMGQKNGRSDDFQQMVSDMRKQNQRRVTIHPEKKYHNLMIEELFKSKLPQQLKEAVAQTLQDRLSQVELIECITSINALKNNEFQVANKTPSILRDKPQSRNVQVNFGDNFLRKIFRRLRVNISLGSRDEERQSIESNDFSPSQRQRRQKNIKIDEEQVRFKLGNIALVMRKELNRIAHPFGKINKTFAQYIEDYCRSTLPKNLSEDAYEKAIRVLIQQWCGYLQSSCLQPYRKWIIGYTGIEEKKYTKWMKNFILQEIWALNNGYLFSMLAAAIQIRKQQLKIDFQQLQVSAAKLTPSLFNIDTKLQIEGHFFDSIYELSELVSRVRPEKVLSQLQTVKKRICTDIDNYHRLVQRDEIYEIDSDNILGIVAYILCKIASKIDQIHSHLVFLRIIYADPVYYNMGIGSYMLSTIFGAIEFLQSEEFQALLGGKVKVEKCCMSKGEDGVEALNLTAISNAKAYSETKGTLSVKEECESKGDVSMEAQVRVGSMVLQ